MFISKIYKTKIQAGTNPLGCKGLGERSPLGCQGNRRTRTARPKAKPNLEAITTPVIKNWDFPRGLLPLRPPHPWRLHPPDPMHLGGLRPPNSLHRAGCASKPLHLGAAPPNPCNVSTLNIQCLNEIPPSIYRPHITEFFQYWGWED